ncbi:RuBisCO large subunit C-terminal-like domain-containing protein [Persephonella sp.]
MNFIEATYIFRSRKKVNVDYIYNLLKKISIFNERITPDRKYIPKVTEADLFYDENRKIYEYILKIGYPVVLFEHDLSSILSIVRKISVYSGSEDIVLVNVDFPPCFMDHFTGPKLGLTEIKKILKIEHKPILAAYISPFLGISFENYLKIFEDLAFGGADVLIEDSTFIDDRLIPFDKRVELCLKKAEQIEKDTGKKIIYIPVLTGSISEIFDKARFAESLGVYGFHIDIDPYGFEFLRSLSERTDSLITVSGSIFARKDMETAVYVKLLRLAGADIINITSPLNEGRVTLNRTYELIRSLTDRWEGINPTFPMLSGYTKPSDLPDIYKEFGNQVIINIENSCYDHPEGLSAGMKTFRYILECIIKGISVDDCRKENKDIDLALARWGSS